MSNRIPNDRMKAYELVSMLGKRTQATVYKVRHEETKSLYMLKMRPLGDSCPPQTELKQLQTRGNRHFCRVYEAFTHEANWCVVMEYYESGNLRDQIERAQENKSLTGKGFKEDERLVLRWSLALSEGLEFMHQRKIIHRDLKPENIFVDKHNQIKIGDLGIASQNKQIASTGYAAPEVWARDSSSSDVFSLGRIILDLLTLSTQQVDSDESRIASIPSPFWQALLRALLAKDPEKRPTATATKVFLKALREEMELSFQKSVKNEKTKRSPKPCDLWLALSLFKDKHRLQGILMSWWRRCLHNSPDLVVSKVFPRKGLVRGGILQKKEIGPIKSRMQIDSLPLAAAIAATTTTTCYNVEENQIPFPPEAGLGDVSQKPEIKTSNVISDRDQKVFGQGMDDKVKVEPSLAAQDIFFIISPEHLDPRPDAARDQKGRGLFGEVFVVTWNGRRVAMKKVHAAFTKFHSKLARQGYVAQAHKVMQIVLWLLKLQKEKEEIPQKVPHLLHFIPLDITDIIKKYMGTDNLAHFFEEEPKKPVYQQLLEYYANFSHPSLIQLYGVCVQDAYLYFILELTPENLHEKVSGESEEQKQCENRDWAYWLKVLWGLVEGIRYLHHHNVVLRNLTSRNVLLRDPDSPYPVAISDYGLLGANEDEGSAQEDIKDSISHTRWLAPEILEMNEYSKSSDIYALSMIMYEILTSEIPFHLLTSAQVMLKVYGGKRPQIPDCLLQRKDYPFLIEYIKLMENCWKPEPLERPDVENVRNTLETMRFQVQNLSAKKS